jgi:hypothetical protein
MCLGLGLAELRLVHDDGGQTLGLTAIRSRARGVLFVRENRLVLALPWGAWPQKAGR